MGICDLLDFIDWRCKLYNTVEFDNVIVAEELSKSTK